MIKHQLGFFMLPRITPVALLFLVALNGLAKEKLIARTFDDGRRPYVLFGKSGSPGLIEVLDQNKVNVTFFVMAPNTYTLGDRLRPRSE